MNRFLQEIDSLDLRHAVDFVSEENLEKTSSYNLSLGSTYNNVVRKFDLETRQTSTLAGPGNPDDPRGTNGAGTEMKLVQPNALAITPDGKGVVIAGEWQHTTFGSHRASLNQIFIHTVSSDDCRLLLCLCCMRRCLEHDQDNLYFGNRTVR